MRRRSVSVFALLALVATGCTSGGGGSGAPGSEVGASIPLDGSPEPSPTSAPTLAGAWDETGFTTNGYLSPVGISSDVDSTVVAMPDGTLMLLYVGSDHRVRWEHYRADGSIIRAPRFEVGVLPRPVGELRPVTSFDAIAIPSGIAVVQDVSRVGPMVFAFDDRMAQVGQPVWVGGHQTFPSLATDGETLWVAATGMPETGPQPSGQSIVITEIGLGTPMSFQRQYLATTPPPSQLRAGRYLSDLYPDIAHDAATDSLAVTYERFSTELREPGQIRLAVLDAETGGVRHDALVTGTWFSVPYYRINNPGVTVIATDGVATLSWKKIEPDGRGHYRVAIADLGSGAVTPSQDVNPSQWSRNVLPRQDWYANTLLDGPDELLLLGLQGSYPVGGTSHAPRFALFPVPELTQGTASLLLDGGFPIYADLVLDLTAFTQNPRICVAGHPCYLEGSLSNRGTRTASGVFVDVSIDGAALGSVSVGTVGAGKSVPFVARWTPDPNLTAEQVSVRYAIRTTSTQYTTDNDAAGFAAEVRQTGIVFGRVVDVSGDPSGQTDLYPGLGGASVDLGPGTTQVTEEGGFFAFEDLAFGTYQLSMERDGYKPASGTVTVSRTDPIAFVPIQTDDHGLLGVQVVDEAGHPLADAHVTLLEASDTQHSGSDPLVYSLSAGPHAFAFSKRGYTAVDRAFTVALDQDVTETVTLQAATSGSVGGQVLDRYGDPVAGATVVVRKAGKTEAITTLTTAADGAFGPIDLPAGTSVTWYELVASGPDGSSSVNVDLYGGDSLSYPMYLLPASADGSLKGVASTEGYTSWMIKASWPGLGWVAGTDMFVWQGNYSIRIGAEYWTDTEQIHSVDVTVQGNAYEAHATKSEIDFGEVNQDYADVYKTLNVESTEVTSWVDVVPTLTSLGPGGMLPDVIELGEQAVDLWDALTDDDYVVTGQGPEVLTWREAKEDFVLIPEPDTSSFGSSVRSVWDTATAIPTSFAIPVVIGGSSPEQTVVRVDEIDIVSSGAPHTVLWSSNPTPGNLYSADTFSSNQDIGSGGLNMNGRRYLVDEGIDKDTAVILVFLTVQKLSQNGDVGGTSFEQREQQVVEFRIANRAMGARIAPGDLYLHP